MLGTRPEEEKVSGSGHKHIKTYAHISTDNQGYIFMCQLVTVSSRFQHFISTGQVYYPRRPWGWEPRTACSNWGGQGLGRGKVCTRTSGIPCPAGTAAPRFSGTGGHQKDPCTGSHTHPCQSRLGWNQICRSHTGSNLWWKGKKEQSFKTVRICQKSKFLNLYYKGKQSSKYTLIHVT